MPTKELLLKEPPTQSSPTYCLKKSQNVYDLLLIQKQKKINIMGIKQVSPFEYLFTKILTP